MCVLGRVNITYYTTKTISVKPKLKNEISNIWKQWLCQL